MRSSFKKKFFNYFPLNKTISNKKKVIKFESSRTGNAIYTYSCKTLSSLYWVWKCRHSRVASTGDVMKLRWETQDLTGCPSPMSLYQTHRQSIRQLIVCRTAMNAYEGRSRRRLQLLFKINVFLFIVEKSTTEFDLWDYSQVCKKCSFRFPILPLVNRRVGEYFGKF